MVAGIPFAFARSNCSDLDSPSVLFRAGKLDPLRATVCGDAAVIQSILPPPFAFANRVRQEMGGQTLPRTDQLPDWLNAATQTIGDKAGRIHLPTGELLRFWKEGNMGYLERRGILAPEPSCTKQGIRLHHNLQKIQTG